MRLHWLTLLLVLTAFTLFVTDICEAKKSKRRRDPKRVGGSSRTNRKSRRKSSKKISRLTVQQLNLGSQGSLSPWWTVSQSSDSLPSRSRFSQRSRSLEDILADFLGHTGGTGTTEAENKPKPLRQPHSGQWIRLRGTGSYLNSGIVEVYRAGQWGVICDDSWDIKDANVACKQLGFGSGAASVEKEESLTPDLWSQRPILMDELQCTGSEARVQECSYSTQHDCTVDEAAALTCRMEQDCPEGWFFGFGKCYKLFTQAKGIKQAMAMCSQSNASLINIDSAEENHFISNTLKKSAPDLHTWFTGGKKTKKVWKWFKFVVRKQFKSWKAKQRKSRSRSRKWRSKSPFKKARSAVRESSWFPGWPNEIPSLAEPMIKRRHDCLALSDQFEHPERGLVDVDYFFWKASPCRLRGGINFICQLEKAPPTPETVADCYKGKGTNYRGKAQVTRNGTPCLPWSRSGVVNDRTHPGKGLGDHNYCRNPDNDSGPWCWVNHAQKKFGFCDIPQCSNIPQTTPGPSTTPEPGDLNCPASEFYCEHQRTCIPEDFRCDNEEDCSYGEDEQNCVYQLPKFTMYQDSRLDVRKPGITYSTATYRGMSDERCAQACLDTTDFVCRSFLYDSMNRSCLLSEYNSGDGSIVSSYEYDYYQLSSQMDCSGKFVCSNSFCVDHALVCDGKDDCKDLSDEANCGQEEDSSVSVSLVGGEEHSGTVLVTYKGSTGVICDDRWDIKDAQVVCRMLGYRGAVSAVSMNAFDYPPERAVFLLDNVECVGTEASLADCPKSNWKQHDCKAYEIAGVTCQLSKVCEVDQFRCDNKLCVPAQNVCDGEDDCTDGSDERDCRAPRYYLVNGTTDGEGRVEISRNGLRGTICDDHWDDVDAGVFCRTMGFRYGGKALSGARFGSGEGPIWLDNVACSGRETSLARCQHAGWGISDCDHSEDAGVRCYSRPPVTTRAPTTSTTTTTTTTTSTTEATTTLRTTTPKVGVSVSLVGGRSPNEGTVQLTVGGRPYRICDDYWEDQDATVVCRMLGYHAGGTATEKSFFDQQDRVPFILDNVECVGSESTLLDCKAIVGENKHDCSHEEKAGVICNKLGGTTPAPSEAQTSPRTNTEGTCGQRPYDYLDLLGGRYKRSPITDRGHYRSGPGDDDLFSPRKLEKAHHTKIVGGRFAAHGAYPWQVRVHKIASIRPDGTVYGSHHCGGVVISEYWILSAAHCFYGKRKSEFQMIVGDHHQRQRDKGEQVFGVEEIINHPNYRSGSTDYDITLIKVKPQNGRGIQFNNYVQPACLPDENTPYTPGTRCYISGWGNTQSVNRYPETLKAAEVPLIDLSRCQYLYDPRRRGAFTDRMMCAGYVEGGIDTCDGDSGGPLVCNIKGLYTLMGLTSWGRGCAQPNAPGVYARVPVFLNWIDRTIQQNSETRAEKELPKKP